MFNYSYPQRKYIYPAFGLCLMALFLMHYAVAMDSAPSGESGKDVVRAMDEARSAAEQSRVAVNRSESAARQISSSSRAAVTRADNAVRSATNAAERNIREEKNALERKETDLSDRLDRAIHPRSDAANPRRVHGRQDQRNLEDRVDNRREQLRDRDHTQNDWIEGWHNDGRYMEETGALHKRNDHGYIEPVESRVTGRYVDGSPSYLKENELAPERGDLRYTEERLRMDERRMSALRNYQEKRNDLQNQLSVAPADSNEYHRLRILMDRLDKEHADNENRFQQNFRNMDAKYSGNSW